MGPGAWECCVGEPLAQHFKMWLNGKMNCKTCGEWIHDDEIDYKQKPYEKKGFCGLSCLEAHAIEKIADILEEAMAEYYRMQGRG